MDKSGPRPLLPSRSVYIIFLAGLVRLDNAGLMEGGEEEKMNDLKEALEMYDADGNGFITPRELKIMLTKLGEFKSIDECK
ncbi:Calcium-binding protein CML39 [Hibiscus syriacus]|uniref:Calcium-binding protein CML39 n=1 Tax=Hibiscus syriacus TaxID=106335 RepID=A0A6A3A275_HIBSY|nr:Calcium-binding protein CML39 [Hibiscus syriacus]